MMRAVSVHDLKAALDATGGEGVGRDSGATGSAVGGVLGGDLLVVDVREPWEYAEGHVPGALPMPLATVPQRAGELPVERPIYLVCAVGGRSGQAAAYLSRLGLDAVNVEGGTEGWIAAGYPVDR